MILSMLALIHTLGCADVSKLETPYVKQPCAEWPADRWVGDGELVSCDAQRIVVKYPAGQADAVIGRWRTGLQGDGWTVVTDNSEPGAPSIHWQKGEKTLVTGIATADGATWATAAWGAPPTEPKAGEPTPAPVPTKAP